MAKVGTLNIDPKVGAYCQVKLDSGEKILLNHDKGDLKSGALTITEVKWWGLGSGETLFRCQLETPEGAAVLRRLTGGAREGSTEATPFGALLEQVKTCRSITEVKARCAELNASSA